MQLDLFSGEHVPLLRYHVALDRGELRGARAALAEAALRVAEPAMSRALAMLEAELARARGTGDRAAAVHDAFVAALAEVGFVRAGAGAPARRDWFRLYAAHVAEALTPTPARRFRGWCSLHFDLAAGRPEAALRSAECLTRACREGWAWLEAARAAHAAGDGDRTRRLAVVACLVANEELVPDPPVLRRVFESALDAPDLLVPRLPDAIEELWSDARWLELATPAAAWVPALGVLADLFPPALLRSDEVREASGFDPDAAPPPSEPPGRAFLRALLAARDAHAREAALRSGACGDTELRARARMRALSPELLARYLESLGGALLPRG